MTQDRIEEITENSPRCLTQRMNQVLELNEDFTLENVQIILTQDLRNPQFHAFMHLKRRIWGPKT